MPDCEVFVKNVSSRLARCLGLICAPILAVSLVDAAPAAAQPEIVSGSTDVGHTITADPRTAEFFDHMVRQRQNSPFKDVPLPPFFEKEAWYPTAAPQDFSAPRLVGVADDGGLRLQRWFIESPAMRRVVEVQIMHPVDAEKPAPMLYLLDGATAATRSGWVRSGKIDEIMANEQLTVVMPTQASGSMYMDWEKPDPVIGHPMWETFLTTELPTILEKPAQGLRFDGKRIIAGLSMGASGAIRLANAHPTLFHGAIGLSGCYSYTSPMSIWKTKAVVESVRANPANLWANGYTEQARRMDVVHNPTGLRTMPVYLFTGNGVIGPQEKRLYNGHITTDMIGGVALEFATDTCTHELDHSMRAHGITHQKFVYEAGIHDWPYYTAQLPLALAHIRSAWG